MAQNFEARNSSQPGTAYLLLVRPSFQFSRFHFLSFITRRFRDFVPPATRVMEKGLARSAPQSVTMCACWRKMLTRIECDALGRRRGARARAASRSTRSHRYRVQSRMRGFFAMSARPRRARHGRRRVRGVCGAMLCVVYGLARRVLHVQTSCSLPRDIV